jgi:hypothetical protein
LVAIATLVKGKLRSIWWPCRQAVLKIVGQQDFMGLTDDKTECEARMSRVYFALRTSS